MRGDERRALCRALLGMLQRAFPFEHRPAFKAILREFRKDGAEIDLSIAQRAEATGTLGPIRITAIDASPTIGTELGVLDVEAFDPLVINIDEGEIIELLQDEVA